MAKGAYDYWWCVTDIPIHSDLQVRETQINVPENGKSGTHKYIRHEKIDIFNKVASVRFGSADGVALPIVAVRNPFQFFSA